MLRYLTGESNVRGAPNENYARELMELFALGVNERRGRAELHARTTSSSSRRRSRAGRSTTRNPDAAKSVFVPSRWYNGPKIVFGKFGNYKARDAVDLVLSQPSARARTSCAKIWGEFVVTPPDTATLGQARRAPTSSSGFQLKPLLEQILSHPLLFESLGEPNMLKPPVVYVVGAMRALARRDHRPGARRPPRRDGPGPLLPADGGGLGGRPVLAEHEHGAGALRLRAPSSSARPPSPTSSARPRPRRTTARTRPSDRRGSRPARRPRFATTRPARPRAIPRPAKNASSRSAR